jgi:hypothetical protein
VDRVAARAARRRDDRRRIQIGGRAGAAQRERIVGGGDVAGAGIVLGKAGDGGDAQAARRARDPQRDLAAIGDQQAFDAFSPARRRRSPSVWLQWRDRAPPINRFRRAAGGALPLSRRSRKRAMPQR